MKKYLASLFILTRPKAGETLFLYLVTFDKVVGMILIAERDGEQRLIYYISKVLHDAKVKHQKIEKLAYAMVLVFRRLKHYFQAHLIMIRID